MITKHFTEDMIEDIATEQLRGRVLMIGTVNLDAKRPVIWNIGPIGVSLADGTAGI